MKRLIGSNLGYRLLALVLAILLFAYVKTDRLTVTRNNTDTNQNKSALMTTKTATIEMPVDLDINTSKYIVSGYRENVKVKITGPSALVTTLTNTRNFKVYLDLNEYALGKHNVKYKVTGLGRDINYEVQPTSANINIAKRQTKSFPISYRYDTNMAKNGYTMGNPKSSTNTVQATGAAGNVAQVAQVIANVSVPSNSTSDVSTRTVLQALDANGNVVNVILTPQSINVTIPITKNVDLDTTKTSTKESSEKGSSDTSTAKSSSTTSESKATTSSSNSTSSN